MGKASKFGYGFLLLGVSMPHLIEHLFGAGIALIASLLCMILGSAFLYSGHLHREENEKPISLKTKIATGVLLFAICIVVCLMGWRVLHVKHATAMETVPPTTVPSQIVIQQKSQDDTCSNVVAGRDVNANCTEKEHGNAKH